MSDSVFLKNEIFNNRKYTFQRVPLMYGLFQIDNFASQIVVSSTRLFPACQVFFYQVKQKNENAVVRPWNVQEEDHTRLQLEGNQNLKKKIMQGLAVRFLATHCLVTQTKSWYEFNGMLEIKLHGECWCYMNLLMFKGSPENAVMPHCGP